MKCEQGWECVISWLLGDDGMKQSLFKDQLKLDLICSEDATIACCKVVVAASSHRRSPGGLPGRVKYGQQSRLLFVNRDRFPSRETYQL